MLLWVAGRLVFAAAQLFVVTLVLFVLFFVAPGPDLSVSSAFAEGVHRGQVQQGRFQETGSAVREYLAFVRHVTHGQLGRSQRSHQEISELVLRAWPATASLVAGALVVWVLVALAVGIVSALRPRSLLDRAGATLVIAGVSAHPLWLGLVVSWLFGYELDWFPLVGYCDMFEPSLGSGCGGPVQWTYHLVLPWLVFATGFAALYARMLRASLLDQLAEDYVRTAYAKGLSTRQTVLRHALRNALLPVATMATMDIGLAFGGTLFVEKVFQIPGIGSLLIHALPRPDLPVVLGVVLTVSVVAVVCALLLDVVAAIVDPAIVALPFRRAAPVS